MPNTSLVDAAKVTKHLQNAKDIVSSIFPQGTKASSQDHTHTHMVLSVSYLLDSFWCITINKDLSFERTGKYSSRGLWHKASLLSTETILSIHAFTQQNNTTHIHLGTSPYIYKKFPFNHNWPLAFCTSTLMILSSIPNNMRWCAPSRCVPSIILLNMTSKALNRNRPIRIFSYFRKKV